MCSHGCDATHVGGPPTPNCHRELLFEAHTPQSTEHWANACARQDIACLKHSMTHVLSDRNHNDVAVHLQRFVGELQREATLLNCRQDDLPWMRWGNGRDEDSTQQRAYEERPAE